MSDNDLIEAKTIELGQHLLNKMRINELKYQQQEGWVEKLFSHLVDNERFRVQALRFVDVLPALDNAADLARHMQEYFTPEELNYPGLSKWWSRLSAGSMTPRLIAPTIRKAMRLLGQRFLAGETVDDLYKTIKTYQAKNLESSLDLLGEAVVSEKQADKYLAEYINLIESLATKPGFLNSQSKSDAISKSDVSQINISVKPSSLYSQITHLDTAQSISGIAVRLRSLFRVAMHHNAFVMLDMEQYELKDIVLGVFKRILIEHEFQHWSDVGIAIQAYLKEAEVDVQQLIDWTKQRGTPVTVRLVKGAYWDAELIIAKQNG